MKTGFVVFAAQVILLSSTAFGQSAIEKEVPNFFSPGVLTALSISPRLDIPLPTTHEEYVALVVDGYSQDTSTQEPSNQNESDVEKFCKAYPGTRQCVHGRYFDRSRSSRSGQYGSESAKYRNLRYVRHIMKHDPRQHSNLYRYSEIYVGHDTAILFSTNAVEQAAGVARLTAKLSRTSNPIGLVYVDVLSGEGVRPRYGRYIPASDIRFVDEACGFYGTTEEFLSDYACAR